jgi:hypothetical protein
MTEFLPLAHRFAEALEQVSAEEAERDAAAAVHAITAAVRRFGWSVAVTHWDLGGEAEALGAELDRGTSGASVTARRPGSAGEAASVTTIAAIVHKMAVTHGIRGALGPRMGLAAMLTGPRTLSGLLNDSGRLGALYGSLIRAYVEAGADRLLIVEGSRAARPASAPGDYSRTLRSLASTARYFRAPTMMLDLGGADLSAYSGFDHVFGRDSAVLLPTSALCGSPSETSVSLANASVVTTAGQIPADCPPALVASWTEHVQGPGRLDSPMVS